MFTETGTKVDTAGPGSDYDCSGNFTPDLPSLSLQFCNPIVDPCKWHTLFMEESRTLGGKNSCQRSKK